MRRTTNTSLVLLALGILATLNVAALVAGPLNPPAGAVTGTYKTLTEVEPRTIINSVNTPGDADSVFKITTPGSYYLTGNVIGVAGKHGIKITSSGVTIDLNGFEVFGSGPAGSSRFDGITIGLGTFNAKNIAIMNGSVRNWSGEGIDLGTFLTYNGRITNVAANSNGGAGIFAGFNFSVSGCSASHNGGNGVFAGQFSTVMNCEAVNNTLEGILANAGSAVQNCAAGNNLSTGIRVGGGGSISNCSAYANSGIGIAADGGVLVVNCSASSNLRDGIFCTAFCTIRGNDCTFNGTDVSEGAGIHATQSDNRIEGNNCTNADRGVDVDAGGNIIIGNTCSGNTNNWDIAPGNSVGPIVTAGTNALTITGNGASPSTLGSTDPFTNFNY
ncbi:MAG: right-handed parallel beta-helix repeat-containing protein [Planctomycetes bacterium]|nr:right-handed parallel beta-helix repeat-containing protein [Planctomycetota bacterium]